MNQSEVETKCICSRCGLIAIVPSDGRSIWRLGTCPSCDMVAWTAIESTT
jgi:transposase